MTTETAATTKRPYPFIDDRHLSYLDGLRETGVTNMFGATPFLRRAFPTLTDEQAGDILTYWMKSFGRDDR